MLISTAYAQAAGGAEGGAAMLMQFLPLVLIVVVFYFLLFRPQQKRAKEHKALLEAVRRGDTVVTMSGLIGKVAKVQDGEVVLEVAEGVRVRILKGTISEVRAKGQPVGDDEK
ncbi:preprotein translocase subunit YajC [Zavarzinia compransoris]|uniref:preprotein translocase subunit YajC n=1 Tax=Zavarzinia marina TaxID=2911065 RepID=UPI001F47C955|nr:preprotein translocase subunit YajC [Zavarzinia marina]MCF4164437.1 preprotein translocase subunit YajC [Zavarzinia marina]